MPTSRDLFGPLDPTAPPDTEAEHRALVALGAVPGVGPSAVRALLAGFGAATRVMRASPSALQQVRGIGPQTASAIAAFDDWDAVDRQFARAEQVGACLVAPWHAAFPRRLRQIYDPPAFLWQRGTLAPEDARAVAIVGTRRCTDYGRRQARRFAIALVQHGFTIVSGLAYGIDAAAHRAALDAGGRTVAVLGSGLGRVYPAKHAGLVRQMEDGRGAVLSEYALDAEPDAHHFPERNRIVSGLALGALVVESFEKGGALITARMAVEQGREVFAVPGLADARASAGCNRLIQRGHAKLVMTVEDVLEELNAPPRASSADGVEGPASASGAPNLDARLGALTPDARRLYDALGPDALGPAPVHIDALCRALGLDASTALVRLLELEFAGLVRQLAGKQFCRA
jgi:DNA processing protein